MKLAIFTSNGIRHKFVANTLSKNVDETLVICESNQNDALNEISFFIKNFSYTFLFNPHLVHLLYS